MNRRYLRLALALAALALLLSACGGDKSSATRPTLLVVVNAPFTRTPYLGQAIESGVRLAASEQNQSGVPVGKTTYNLRVQTMDSALSPAQAVANMRRAVGEHAIAVVDEGTGIDASWRVAAPSRTPIGVVFEGGKEIVDPATRPNVFRIAPTDHGVAFRLAEYLIPKHPKIALLHDDSDYGTAGAAALRQAFAENQSSVAIDETLPANALDLSPQILRARRAHADALIVWGRPATIASAITAARTAGWQVPFYTPPTGSDPFVRQRLANHPAWVNDLTFASGRLTAEVGVKPFQSFEHRLQSAYGPELVGVKTKAGLQVVQPPETAMYAYDFVNVLAAALRKAATTDRAQITKALNEVVVEGANGDSRGFNQHNHDGVVDDDVYFARFHGMTYAPVRDDPLSATLPEVPQTR